MTDRLLIPARGPWGAAVGYSRAVRAGDLVEVSGTTAIDADGAVLHPGDAYAQAHAAFAIVREALEAAGAALDDVIRTRAYLVRITDWEAVGRAHREVFGAIAPASTMVGVRELLLPELLLEVEATALCLWRA
jgi:enamine deaminase RidA (YjgF/YER057c/UK114 family)